MNYYMKNKLILSEPGATLCKPSGLTMAAVSRNVMEFKCTFTAH